MLSNKLPDNLSMPACTMIPVLEYPNIAEGIMWLTNTLGFKERWRVGGHRAQLAFEDCAIAITEVRPGKQVSCAAIMLRVKDVSLYYLKAKQLGVEVLRPPSDFPYGERQCTLRDNVGHIWTLSQTIANVAPEEWGGVSVEL